MNKLRIAQNSAVRAGDKIGLISADFGGVPTPVHLHFEMLQNIGGKGFRHVPPYMSLVRSYQRLPIQP
jgi:murein DD-endopeptidase MepM/ murein hydrolase activator NlpD